MRRDPSRPGTIYAATVGGLHRSTDGGKSWERVSRESLVVTALAVDPRSGRLYVGTEGEGVFTSDDGGATLDAGATGLAEGRVADLVPDPNDSSRVYFFRAYGGEESGVWVAEGTQGPPRLGGRAAGVGVADGVSRRGGQDGPDARLVERPARLARRRRALDGVAEPPPGAPVAVFGAPYREPVLVTSQGVFRVGQGGRSFAAVDGAPSGAIARGAARRFRPAPRARGQDGRHRLSLGRPQLERPPAGASSPEASSWPRPTPRRPMAYSSLQDVNGKLIWEEGNRRLALTSPRAGLALATAAAAPGGRVYVGTTGDGLYLFEP